MIESYLKSLWVKSEDRRRGSQESSLTQLRLSRRQTGTEENWAARAGEDSREAEAEEPYLQLQRMGWAPSFT
jgi:hypothetical protein